MMLPVSSLRLHSAADTCDPSQSGLRAEASGLAVCHPVVVEVAVGARRGSLVGWSLLALQARSGSVPGATAVLELCGFLRRHLSCTTVPPYPGSGPRGRGHGETEPCQARSRLAAHCVGSGGLAQRVQFRFGQLRVTVFRVCVARGSATVQHTPASRALLRKIGLALGDSRAPDRPGLGACRPP